MSQMLRHCSSGSSSSSLGNGNMTSSRNSYKATRKNSKESPSIMTASLCGETCQRMHIRDRLGRTQLQYHASSLQEVSSSEYFTSDVYEIRQEQKEEASLRQAHKMLQYGLDLDYKKLRAYSAEQQEEFKEHHLGHNAAEQSNRRKRSASIGSNNFGDDTRRLLIARDDESGYTALHRAVYNRDLSMMLLLLRFAWLHSHLEEEDGSGVAALKNQAHFMTLLECGADSNQSNKSLNHGLRGRARSGSMCKSTAEQVSSVVDHEGLTALQLLGELYASDLSLTKPLVRSQRALPRPLQNATVLSRKMSHFVNDVEEDDVFDHLMSDGNELELGEDSEGHIAFPRYAPPTTRHDDDDDGFFSQQFQSMSHQRIQGHNQKLKLKYAYGTEVVTFGQSEHAALGHFHTSSASSTKNTAKKSSSSCPMGRVKPFASTPLIPLQEEESGPAVAIAAAAHHSLVVTSNGHLYAFGLGKGGRLGTGDEQNRPLPHRVAGPFLRLRVTSISAAENHSLCSTSDGMVYAWGSNRFGQLGIARRRDVHGNRGGSGGTSKNSNASNMAAGTKVATPLRVEELKKDFISSVAAGERHSVVLTRKGEIYAWGDNRAGQLGWSPFRASIDTVPGSSSRRNPSKGGGGTATTSSSPSATPGPLTTHVHGVYRVEALWSAKPRRKAIQIAASDKMTLAITQSSTPDEFGNSVYSWGHDNYLPCKVNFPKPRLHEKKVSQQQQHHEQQTARFMKQDVVNPVKIACAKYHNVAVTSDGRVYTWGLHAEHLAREAEQHKGSGPQKQSQQSQSPQLAGAGASTNSSPSSSSCTFRNDSETIKLSSPQLVKAMLPHNGGGKAVAVSASEHHTAVVTSAGHLYTWGATYGNHVLGHFGVKYQPCPKRVPGVVRAVDVAAARDHTALLLGTTVPQYSCGVDSVRQNKVPSLQSLAEKVTAQHVDLYNVIPILITAERTHAANLVNFCSDFVKLNMDGVLATAKKSDLDVLLDERLQSCVVPKLSAMKRQALENDGFWPLWREDGVVSSDKEEERYGAVSSNVCLYATQPPEYTTKSLSSSSATCTSTNESTFQTPNKHEAPNYHKGSCSNRMAELMNTPTDLTNPESVQVRYEALSKAMRSVKKKLNLINELENTRGGCGGCKSDATEEEEKKENRRFTNALSPEQEQKMARRPELEADLELVKPALEEVERKMIHFNLFNKNLSTTSAEKKCSSEILDERKGAVVVDCVKEDESSVATTEQLVKSKKYHCEVCNATCPDKDSLELHMNGRRHRNRVRHLEEQAAQDTATRLMNTKKRLELQQMGSSDAITPVWDQRIDLVLGGKSLTMSPVEMEKQMQQQPVVEPRYCLAPPSNVASKEGRCESQTSQSVAWSPQKSDWSQLLPRKGKTAVVASISSSSANSASSYVGRSPTAGKKLRSLQEIMEEEEFKRKKERSNGNKPCPLSSRCVISQQVLLFSKENSKLADQEPKTDRFSSLKSNSEFVAKRRDISVLSSSPVPSRQTSSLSLSSYISHEVTKSNAKLSAASKKASARTRAEAWSTKTHDCTEKQEGRRRQASFDEIQKEEQERRKMSEQKYVSAEKKWYVHEQERARSIDDIQKQQQEEMEFQKLVEEQKEIEAQIERDRMKEQKEKERRERLMLKKKRRNNARREKRKLNGQNQNQKSNTKTNEKCRGGCIPSACNNSSEIAQGDGGSQEEGPATEKTEKKQEQLLREGKVSQDGQSDSGELAPANGPQDGERRSSRYKGKARKATQRKSKPKKENKSKSFSIIDGTGMKRENGSGTSRT